MSKRKEPQIIISLASLPIMAVVLEYCIHNVAHFKLDSGVDDEMVSIIQGMLAEVLATMSVINNENQLQNPKNKTIN